MKTLHHKIAISTCTAIFCLFFVGCKNFLDTKPSDFYSPEEYYNTEAQLNTALVGVYDPLGSSELYSYNISSMFGTEADEGYYNRSSAEGPQIYDFTSAHTRIRTTWQKLYQGIHRANLVLANVNKPEMSTSARNIIIGEAKFLRAFYYFLLVTNWGGVPLVTQPTESPIDNGVARNTDKEVYEFILAEMKEAEAKVRDIEAVGNAGRVNKSAVRGILARVCLHMAGYPLNDHSKYAEARDWVKKVMDSGHALNPDYKQIFINYAQDKYDLKESIWEVEFWGNGSDTYSEAGWIGVRLGVATSDVTLGFRYGIIRTTEKYYHLFEDSDVRREWTIAPYKYSGKTPVNHGPSDIYDRDIAKWRREYELDKSTSLTAQNFPLLRYSDVLLMYAEAETMASNTAPSPQAFEAINQVRRRAFALPIHTPDPMVDLSGLDHEQFMKVIKDERSRELGFEGLRKHDLIRWGDFLTVMKDMEVELSIGGAPSFAVWAFTNVQPKHVLFPIPVREMALNKQLTQNPGW
ncbi:RagB/SusD family nutrient uptake outer membrane protein [Sphingobacterium paucimobilis]|uniref:Carbohydrate-binding protein SusD n=1 Tax=Sphingobacterium paucimobilis HER1398 TaxID=1346330 RepID=U2J1U9_9SPHI|nr:RagB/SusD family nutrient uptake outer membrane protein [Sphingobacterium paucimobilis]ERJ58939.1 hypothetical protein M472_09160 [Sphingobacterium paucimobilis HER1398]